MPHVVAISFDVYLFLLGVVNQCYGIACVTRLETRNHAINSLTAIVLAT